jgi:hypothetical protein
VNHRSVVLFSSQSTIPAWFPFEDLLGDPEYVAARCTS